LENFELRVTDGISTVTSAYLAPDSPVLYQLDNNQDVSFTSIKRFKKIQKFISL